MASDGVKMVVQTAQLLAVRPLTGQAAGPAAEAASCAVTCCVPESSSGPEKRLTVTSEYGARDSSPCCFDSELVYRGPGSYHCPVDVKEQDACCCKHHEGECGSPTSDPRVNTQQRHSLRTQSTLVYMA
jgi:hypothetical protein